MQLHSISSHPVAGHQRVSAPPPPLEEVVGCDEGTPQPSFLQTEQARCPQLLLRGSVLETFCSLGHSGDSRALLTV